MFSPPRQLVARSCRQSLLRAGHKLSPMHWVDQVNNNLLPKQRVVYFSQHWVKRFSHVSSPTQGRPLHEWNIWALYCWTRKKHETVYLLDQSRRAGFSRVVCSAFAFGVPSPRRRRLAKRWSFQGCVSRLCLQPNDLCVHSFGM